MTTNEEPGRRPQQRSAPGFFVSGPGRLCRTLVFAAFLLGAGCVGTSIDDDPVTTAVPVVIEPIEAPQGTDRVVVAFYESLLAQMLEAHQDRDLQRLRSLLQGCSSLATPDWVAPRIDGFVALAEGLHFELACERSGVLREAGGETASGDAPRPSRASIGAELVYELELPAPPGGPWLLGAGSDVDPVAFQVQLVVREHYLDGTEKRIEDAEVVRLDRPVALADEPLRLPVRIDLGGSEAVRREVDLAVHLLPGYVHREAVRAPVRTTLVATGRAVQWPPGHEVIRTAPLRTLRNAQRLGDQEHFKHVRLAAEFAEAGERAEVVRALMDWVRLGRPDQALVAMAALHALEPVGSPVVGDRDGWLSWWESRR